METKTIIWIALTLLYLVLLAMNCKAFFFQRTIHKIHLKTGLDKRVFSIAIPQSIMVINAISLFRWVVVVALCFFNWIAGVCCLVAGFLLPIILPEQDDYKNMQKMREVLRKRNDSEARILDKHIASLMETF